MANGSLAQRSVVHRGDALPDLAYRQWTPSAPSDEPPVVLVHGMGGDSHTWDRLAARLVETGRTVIAPDLRGHGHSGRADSYRFELFGDDVIALLDHLRLGPVDLVGHSLGGHAVTVAAARRPDLVRRVVLEEAPILLREGDQQREFAKRYPSPVQLWHAVTSLVRSPRAVWAFDRSMTAPAIEQFASADPQWWAELPGLKAPTLVVRGGPTGMVDETLLRAELDILPDAQLVEIPCGHSVHRDCFSRFADVVVPFLQAESR